VDQNRNHIFYGITIFRFMECICSAESMVKYKLRGILTNSSEQSIKLFNNLYKNIILFIIFRKSERIL